MKKKFPPAVSILIGMVLGIIFGYMIFVQFPDRKTAAEIAGYVSLLTDIFLRLIKMIIGPLVFSTLVVGHRAPGRHELRRPRRPEGHRLVRRASLVSLLLGHAWSRTCCSRAPA